MGWLREELPQELVDMRVESSSSPSLSPPQALLLQVGFLVGSCSVCHTGEAFMDTAQKREG